MAYQTASLGTKVACPMHLPGAHKSLCCLAAWHRRLFEPQFAPAWYHFRYDDTMLGPSYLIRRGSASCSGLYLDDPMSHHRLRVGTQPHLAAESLLSGSCSAAGFVSEVIRVHCEDHPTDFGPFERSQETMNLNHGSAKTFCSHLRCPI